MIHNIYLFFTLLYLLFGLIYMSVNIYQYGKEYKSLSDTKKFRVFVIGYIFWLGYFIFDIIIYFINFVIKLAEGGKK